MGSVDRRVVNVLPLIPPACLSHDLPITNSISEFVASSRQAISNIIQRNDKRIIVVVGPCSIHDTRAALEYAEFIKTMIHKHKDNLFIVMRVYFEKPRTTVGWKGLINDPDLNGSFNINKGLRTARQLLININELSVPVGCEFLDTISPQYFSGLVAWGAIGARTVESQLHRELASGLSCPIGFKNGTSGDVKVAHDAVLAAQNPHSFLGVSHHGIASVIQSSGNHHTHIILRGSNNGPNYTSDHIQSSVENSSASIMIDCSHGNSNKKHTNQIIVLKDVAKNVSDGQCEIIGVMIESNLVEGNQKFQPGVTHVESLNYGVSITDSCVNLDTTRHMLETLSKAVTKRRELEKH